MLPNDSLTPKTSDFHSESLIFRESDHYLAISFFLNIFYIFLFLKGSPEFSGGSDGRSAGQTGGTDRPETDRQIDGKTCRWPEIMEALLLVFLGRGSAADVSRSGHTRILHRSATSPSLDFLVSQDKHSLSWVAASYGQRPPPQNRTKQKTFF